MLVLSRETDEKIVFPNLGITVEVVKINGKRVRLGIDAPANVRVLRGELVNDSQVISGPEAIMSMKSGLNHEQRNYLNTAQLAFHLLQKQLEANSVEAALNTLRLGLRALDCLDASSGQTKHPIQKNDAARKPSALLVEDDATECDLLAGVLEMSGIDVLKASDGVQAMIQLAHCEVPDFVLLDMHMPNMDGKRTVQCIRENPEYTDVQVFAVTGKSASEVGIEVGPSTINRWFQKPVEPTELISAIREQFESKVKLQNGVAI
jgi:carbon storage regulator CsrA